MHFDPVTDGTGWLADQEREPIDASRWADAIWTAAALVFSLLGWGVAVMLAGA